MPNSFSFSGQYRVQSRKHWNRGALSGTWLDPTPSLLTEVQVNTQLSQDPRWKQKSKVQLRTIWVRKRTGIFQNEPDILYKTEFFTPDIDSTPFPSHLVDVQKSLQEWKRRESLLYQFLHPEQIPILQSILQDLTYIIANEYFCHEAGHVLGIPVAEKYQAGYFSLNGKALWPLIWLEEFRADLHSFGYALKLLPPSASTAIFIYNILLRLGVELDSVARGQDGYGVIPFCLLSLLEEMGLLHFENTPTGYALVFDSLETSDLMAAMEACELYANGSFTDAELSATSLIDIALHTARYYNANVLNHPSLINYQRRILTLFNGKERTYAHAR